MSEQDNNSTPTPRRRPSVRETRGANQTRSERAASRTTSRETGSTRPNAASRSYASSARQSASLERSRPSAASSRSTSASADNRRRSTAISTTARSSTASQRRSSANAGSSSANTNSSKLPFGLSTRTLIVIALAVVLVIALIAVIAFALGGRSNSQETASNSASSASDALSAADQRGPYSISFVTTGDLIFWREVADFIDLNGGASAMANIADHLAAADVTISNLESPLSWNESEPVYNKDIYIIGRPQAIDGMKNSDITFASLANNHIMDYTGPALKDTLDALDGAGILHAGAGMTEEDASKPAEKTVNGVSIAFLSWTDIVPDYYLAHQDEPGVVTARMDMEDACRRVREAKETHDIVIVAMHWGIEYEDYVSDYQQRDPAHQLVDAGADVILGNHPHVLQGIEFYNGSLIAYAHGNCVFRQAFEFGYTHESYILNFDMTQDGIQNVVATPLYLDDTYGIPDFATGGQAEATLSRLRDISEGMNTAFDIRDGRAYLSPINPDA